MTEKIIMHWKALAKWSVNSSKWRPWKLHQSINFPLVPSKYTQFGITQILQLKKSHSICVHGQKREPHNSSVFHNNNLAPFSNLVQRYGIGSNCFLEYLKIKSSNQSIPDIRTINLDLPLPIFAIINISSSKKLFSKIYKIISKPDNTLGLPEVKWESDLSISPDAAFRTQICKNIYFISKKCQSSTYNIKYFIDFTLLDENYSKWV